MACSRWSARSFVRSLTCLSLEALSLINPYRNGVTAPVSLVRLAFPPSFSRLRLGRRSSLLWLYFLNSSPSCHPGMASLCSPRCVQESRRPRSRVFRRPKRGADNPLEKRTVILRLAINLFVFIYGNRSSSSLTYLSV